MTAGLAITCGHTRKRHAEESKKKRRFGNFKGRKAAFHFLVK
jgi:hypothetical protein